MFSIEAVLKVAQIVADVFEVPLEDILSYNRKLRVVKARHTLYECLNMLGERPSHIAKNLNRDHTTVSKGIIEYDNLYFCDMDFRKKADLVKKQLKPTKYDKKTGTIEVRKG
jgi:chromosomal replication initiation ATPase DnaA